MRWNEILCGKRAQGLDFYGSTWPRWAPLSFMTGNKQNRVAPGRDILVFFTVGLSDQIKCIKLKKKRGGGWEDVKS